MPSDLRLSMAEMPPLAKPVSDTRPELVGTATFKIVFADIVLGLLDHVVVFTFRGRSWRMWHLPGTAVDDDLVRALLHHEEAEAVVVVHPFPVPPDIDAKETMKLAVESAKGKFDHVIAMKAPGMGSNYRFMFKEYPENAQLLWLGVQPTSTFDEAIDRVAGLMGAAKAEA